MAPDTWLRIILIVRKETRCRHIGYSYRLAARILLYAPSHRHDSTYHDLCCTSRGALAGTRRAQWVYTMEDRSDDPSHHERTLLPQSYILFPVSTVIHLDGCVYIRGLVSSGADLEGWSKVSGSTHTHTPQI